MKPAEIFILVVLAIFFIVLLLQLKSNKSPFTFDGYPERKPYVPKWMAKNSMFSYDSPKPMKELKYYACLSGHCGGDTHDFDCLERCRLKAYVGDKEDMYVSPLKEVLCMNLQGEDYYNCLVHNYSRTG